MNRIRDIYHKFSRDKKVKASHFFYDCIFRCSESPHYSGFMSDDARYVEKPTVDHPFSARVAARAIFEDHQYLLDDFELFCSIFEMLLQTLKMTSDENQLVKIKKDGFGGVIVDKVIEERYGGITWYGIDSIVKEFPLKQPPFYQKYEMKINFIPSAGNFITIVFDSRDNVINLVDKIKDKLKKIRKSGLEKYGEYSVENLTFKVLRRTNFIKLINNFKIKAYDQKMSINKEL